MKNAHTLLYQKLVEKYGPIPPSPPQYSDSGKPLKKKLKETLQCTITNDITISISFKELKQIITELIAVNGLALRCINYSGFQKLLSPILKGLGKTAFKINQDSIPKIIYDYAIDVTQIIWKMVKNRFVSLLVDSATRLDRSFLGVNLQYHDNGSAVICNLGLIALEESHTGEYLKRVIVELLEKFGITLNQVVSITSDNGANMIRCIRLIDQQQKTMTQNPTPISDESQSSGLSDLNANAGTSIDAIICNDNEASTSSDFRNASIIDDDDNFSIAEAEIEEID